MWHLEWGNGSEFMVKVTWTRWLPCPYMVKPLKIFYGTKRLMTLKLGMQHLVLCTTKFVPMIMPIYGKKNFKNFPRGHWPWNLVYSIGYKSRNNDLGWPWPFLWQGQICFLMLLHGRKLIEHWVYFQVCSNSAYPRHSEHILGTQESDTGPLVLWVFLSEFRELCPVEKIEMKSCQQDISKSIWARDLKLGQLSRLSD